MKNYPIIFAGAGPGDPELITVKGQKALMEADLIVYAGSLVPETMLKWAKEGADCINSASMHLDEIIGQMVESWQSGKRVVRLHTGDPSMYGAIFEQMAQLKKNNVTYTVIPGVTAAFAAAASMGIEFTLPEITQTLILTRMAGRTPVPEREALESLAEHQAALAIYLSISMIETVGDIICNAYGKDQTCAVAYRVGWPDEKIIYTPASELAAMVKKSGITRQALIIVAKSLNVNLGGDGVEHPSKLYDVNFSHGFRE